MPEISVLLPQPVPARHRPEIERRLYFIATEIVGFTVCQEADDITQILLSCSETVAEPTVRTAVWRMIQEVQTQRELPRREVWQRDLSRPIEPGVYSQMLDRELAVELGPGQVALAQPLLELVDVLDRALTAVAVDELGGREYRYPTLIPTSVLDRTGYLASFPQFVMFVTRLHSDLDSYQSFMADYRESGRLDPSVLASCDDVSTCLPPTMCFHTYGQYAGRQLSPDDQRVITARGKSFRFESRYARSLERLWDFTIREIVFLGVREFVLESRQRFMERAFELMTAWGLGGWCEVANDPFFGDAETAAKAWSQRLLELKYELRLNVSTVDTIAVGSFNYHDTLFGQGFGIRQGGGWVSSACVGFGLERLAYAFVCQHGLDPAGWPLSVRTSGGSNDHESRR